MSFHFLPQRRGDVVLVGLSVLTNICFPPHASSFLLSSSTLSLRDMLCQPCQKQPMTLIP